MEPPQEHPCCWLCSDSAPNHSLRGSLKHFFGLNSKHSRLSCKEQPAVLAVREKFSGFLQDSSAGLGTGPRVPQGLGAHRALCQSPKEFTSQSCRHISFYSALSPHTPQPWHGPRSTLCPASTQSSPAMFLGFFCLGPQEALGSRKEDSRIRSMWAIRKGICSFGDLGEARCYSSIPDHFLISLTLMRS